MLQLSYLALEDPQSFQELTHTPIQPQDLEDRWTSWIVNALYDGGGAYALDQGNHPELASLRAVNSCVAGVDHRMIHGLTGLHPDVKISTGSSEQSNLLTWRLAQTRFKEQQKASFYNAVFTTLLSEWTQETIQRSHTAEDSNSTVYVNPLAQTRLVKEYQKFVTQRAETLFGAELIASDEFKTLLETIEEYPEKIFQALQEAANRSPATNESTS